MKKLLLLLFLPLPIAAQSIQKVVIDGRATGPRFDGIGIVNGGGATSVLLKDYPEKQRNEILDMVYKPKFGASVSSLLVEIPGDGNSTQGSMPSHSHFRGDYNYHRGYTWWIMQEAKRRNAHLSLDGTAWSAPGWVGNGTFFSTDAVDYYISWLQGLRATYGLELDALGCRNEKGESRKFAIDLKQALISNGFSKVKLHGFDNWPSSKMKFLSKMQNDSALQQALDVVSAHTFYKLPTTEEQRRLAHEMGKPIWNTEDHIYKKGYDCLISIVECFNQNYLRSGVTKIINWYDIAGVYPMEPYSEDPSMLLAREPWSGHYEVREALWGYAHYGQFTEVGWQYVDPACVELSKGGSLVTMRSPEGDYSLIIETKQAKEPQTIQVKLKGGAKAKRFCLWRSNAVRQFERLADIKPKGGSFTLTLDPASVYSLSTTTGQQKGSFADIPTAQPFPLPYEEDFEQYKHPEQWGYLPRYTADICGAFELTERPDHQGQCLRQVVGEPTISWAPDWQYYTIMGDSAWTDYEVSADVWLNPGDEAALMGRVCHVGTGYGIEAKGYIFQIDDHGQCQLIVSRGKKNKKKAVGDAEQQATIAASTDHSEGGIAVLAQGQANNISPLTWHRMALRFNGSQIEGWIDGKKIVAVNHTQYAKGMAGLMAPKKKSCVSTPYFDNLSIKPLGRSKESHPRSVNASLPLYATNSR